MSQLPGDVQNFQDGTIVLHGLNDQQVLWNVFTASGSNTKINVQSSAGNYNVQTDPIAFNGLTENLDEKTKNEDLIGNSGVLDTSDMFTDVVFGGGPDMVVDPPYFVTEAVPEPGSMGLICSALTGFWLLRRRRFLRGTAAPKFAPEPLLGAN